MKYVGFWLNQPTYKLYKTYNFKSMYSPLAYHTIIN